MELEGYEKTGNTKIFEIGEHLKLELIPTIPNIDNGSFGKNSLKLAQMATTIPKEYALVDIKEVKNEVFGNYMAIISQNIVPVEVEEYKVPGTDLIGYYYYGKEIVKEDEKGKTLGKCLKVFFK